MYVFASDVSGFEITVAARNLKNKVCTPKGVSLPILASVYTQENVYVWEYTMLVHPFKYGYHFLTWSPIMAYLYYLLV